MRWQAHNPSRCTGDVGLVVVNDVANRPSGGTHGVGNEHGRVIDGAADLAAGQIDADDAPSIVRSALHVQMVDAKEAVEDQVEKFLLEHV